MEPNKNLDKNNAVSENDETTVTINNVEDTSIGDLVGEEGLPDNAVEVVESATDDDSTEQNVPAVKNSEIKHKWYQSLPVFVITGFIALGAIFIYYGQTWVKNAEKANENGAVATVVAPDKNTASPNGNNNDVDGAKDTKQGEVKVAPVTLHVKQDFVGSTISEGNTKLSYSYECANGDKGSFMVQGAKAEVDETVPGEECIYKTFYPNTKGNLTMASLMWAKDSAKKDTIVLHSQFAVFVKGDLEALENLPKDDSFYQDFIQAGSFDEKKITGVYQYNNHILDPSNDSSKKEFEDAITTFLAESGYKNKDGSTPGGQENNTGNNNTGKK